MRVYISVNNKRLHEYQPGETAAIRRKAFRETSVSRNQGGAIEGPLKPPVHHSTIELRGLKGYLTWAKGNGNIVFSV